MMLTQMASHDERSHVASHIDHLDLWNSMAPFTIPLASYDAETNASGIT